MLKGNFKMKGLVPHRPLEGELWLCLETSGAILGNNNVSEGKEAGSEPRREVRECLGLLA